ncbi:MAG: DUF2156 domain-containing protein [Candidatus Omnitrophica bacterium]|nr:DUF2156 domain-containing protein [Candidatus Omnitrophota bacterium]
MRQELFLKNKISLSDRKIFEDFLRKYPANLSPYNFSNIFIWNGFFDIFWCVMEESLCVFYKNNAGCFMYLSPVGPALTKALIKDCFALMDEHNKDVRFARIENVGEKHAEFYRQAGFAVKNKPSDYLYLTNRLIDLKGNDFKSKRAAVNYFTKNFSCKYLPYRIKLKDECRQLLLDWAAKRKKAYPEDYFCHLIDDNVMAQENVFECFNELGLVARVVKVNDKIAGYTFGYELNPQTFCILFEVCDLKYKGISQFIFHEFCREMERYKYINATDDSGIENIRKAKLSFKPLKEEANYLVLRGDKGICL